MAEFHWDIRVADPSPTSRFAAREFARLITLMDDGARRMTTYNDRAIPEIFKR